MVVYYNKLEGIDMDLLEIQHLKPVYLRVTENDLTYSVLKVIIDGRRVLIQGYDLDDCMRFLTKEEIKTTH